MRTTREWCRYPRGRCRRRRCRRRGRRRGRVRDPVGDRRERVVVRTDTEDGPNGFVFDERALPFVALGRPLAVLAGAVAEFGGGPPESLGSETDFAASALSASAVDAADTSVNAPPVTRSDTDNVPAPSRHSLSTNSAPSRRGIGSAILSGPGSGPIKTTGSGTVDRPGTPGTSGRGRSVPPRAPGRLTAGVPRCRRSRRPGHSYCRTQVRDRARRATATGRFVVAEPAAERCYHACPPVYLERPESTGPSLE